VLVNRLPILNPRYSAVLHYGVVGNEAIGVGLSCLEVLRNDLIVRIGGHTRRVMAL
jgi:hypothetical protein